MDLSAITTPDGIILAAALATTMAELAKRLWPALDAQVSGARMVFGATALLYLWAGLAFPPADASAAFTLFAAWLSCATGAIGIHGVASHLTAQAATTPEE